MTTWTCLGLHTASHRHVFSGFQFSHTSLWAPHTPPIFTLFYKSTFPISYFPYSLPSTTAPTTTTMEINRVTNYRRRTTTSSSSRHFHDLFSFTTDTTTDIYGGEDLTEADLFSDSSESTHSPISRRNNHHNNNLGFSGILAALSDENGTRFSTSTTATTQFRSIPKPPSQQRVTNEWTQSVPSRNFQQHSAPMNVPMMMKKPKKFGQLDEFQDYKKDDDDDEEMLPPHEIVAMKLKSTSSVLEGVGRTLKGRDLRQVRNAVWRQTGFLD